MSNVITITPLLTTCAACCVLLTMIVFHKKMSLSNVGVAAVGAFPGVFLGYLAGVFLFPAPNVAHVICAVIGGMIGAIIAVAKWRPRRRSLFATKFSKSHTLHHLVRIDGQQPPVLDIPVDHYTSIRGDVLSSAPKVEIGNYIVYFVPITPAHLIDSYEKLSDECEHNGCVMVNPHLLLKANTDDPSFADRYPNLTMWKNALGRWCYIAFYKNVEGERWVHSGYLADKWFNGDDWHVAVVVRK